MVTDMTINLFPTRPAKFPLMLLVILSVIFNGCSSKLLTSVDYQDSLYQHSIGSPEKALEKFPEEEKGYFITTLEKAYLRLLTGKPDNKPLLDLVDSIDQRIRYQGSREVKSLFYAETAEGYYASEHEIVWLHLLLSWGFSLEKEYEKSCIEARKASHLLSAPWSHEGHFDDAMLRIFLGGLWTMCGSWEDALVAFRKAYQLSPKSVWLQELVDLEEPPKHLFIVLGGIGPDPYWNPDAELNVMRGFRQVGFKGYGQKSDLTLADQSGHEIQMHLSPGSAYWYQRHFERDNAIHELIVDSHYTGRAAGSVTMETAKMAASYALGTTIIVGSVVLGGIVIYIAVQAESGELAAIGAGIILAGAQKGFNVMAETTEDSLQTIKEDLNAAETYRFVRFLPEYLWTGWSNSEIQMTSIVPVDPTITLVNPMISEGTTVTLTAFTPDTDIDQNPYTFSNLQWKKWQNEAFTYLSDETNFASWDKIRNSIAQLLQLANSNSYGIRVHAGDETHRVKVESTSMTATIEGGLFREEPGYQLDLDRKELAVDSAARNELVKIRPSDLIIGIYNQINRQIHYLKNN